MRLAPVFTAFLVCQAALAETAAPVICSRSFVIVPTLAGDFAYRSRALFGDQRHSAPFSNFERVKISRAAGAPPAVIYQGIQTAAFVDNEFDLAGIGPLSKIEVPIPLPNPYVGTFIGMKDATAAFVLVGTAMTQWKLTIPLDDLEPLNQFGADALLQKARPLARARELNPPFTAADFASGERIRFRDPHTQVLRHGVVSDNPSVGRPEAIGIADDSGARRSIPLRLVFKTDKYSAAGTTALFHTPRSDFEKMVLRGELVDYLTIGARLSSNDDYLEASPYEKISLLLAYTRAVMRPEFALVNAMMNGGAAFSTFNDAFRYGVGVCRHLAAALAMLLRESGFDVAIVHALDLKTRMDVAHAWLEVYVPTPQGRKLYVLDPSSEGTAYFKIMAAAQSEAAENPDAIAARYYVRPDASRFQAQAWPTPR